jgi:ribosomal protein S18 acetylase RimI-like enzyme
LAIDQRFKGQGLGSALLADAADRAISSDIAAHFLIVDALDEDATLFYQHHGFRRVLGNNNRLFIPLSVLEKLLRP